MIGREAYHNPEMLLQIDPILYGQPALIADGFEAIDQFAPYISARLSEGVPLHAMTRHLLGLFQGRPGARAFRRHLATEGVKKVAHLATLYDAISHIERSEPAAA
jgi:tRNA-dihydrouridine synthase A